MAIIVLIGGGSASGKTAIARAVVRELDFCRIELVSLDSFYRPAAHRSDEAFNFDHPNAIDTDLLLSTVHQMMDGKEVRIPLYDFATHDRQKETVVVPGTCLVVIEGIHALGIDDLVEMARIRLYFDAPEPVRRQRRLERDVRERGRTPEDVAAQFDEHVAPMHERYVEPSAENADIVINTDRPVDELVNEVTAAVLGVINRESCNTCERRHS